MASVNIDITGEMADVIAASLRLDNVLSITPDKPGTNYDLNSDGSVTAHIIARIDETPGGMDEYEFSHINDLMFYQELGENLDAIWLMFQYLERDGVIKHDAAWWQDLRTFRIKLADFLKSTSE